MHRLERLLRPRSIATFGGGQAAAVVEQCLKMGFTGDIWPVHPTRDQVHGLKAYRSVAELPAAPDASFVAVNRFITIDVIRELSARGAGGAVCYASGFAEYDDEGRRLQQAMVRAAGAMSVIGPNCYGLINYADGALLWPDQHGGVALPRGDRGVAIVTQSGNIACNITMQARGLPLAFMVTTGNQAQTGVSGVALGLIEDPRVSVLGLHIEGFDSVDGFQRLAERACALGKPIVVLKMGRSEGARAATLSHTASLAGSTAASDAFLKRLCVAQVASIPALLEALKLLHVVGPIGEPTIGCLSSSGGEASVVADEAAGRRVVLPKLTADHHARIKATLGPLVTVANPLDYHTFIWNNEPALTATFTAMVSGGFGLTMVVLDFPRTDRCSDADWWPTINAFETALKSCGAKGAVVSSMGENLPENACANLMARGIAPLCGIAEAFDAAEAAAFIAQAWQTKDERWSRTSRLSVPPDITLRAGETSSSTEGGARSTVLSEAAAKAALAHAGLSVPHGLEAATTDEAVSVAGQLGFPVALKALGIAHKSEAGAVALNLKDDAAVREAAHRLIGLGSGLYVERMVERGIAELIVGITRDPLFGPIMTVGSGGVLVELLKDSATLLLPASRRDIEDALRSLKLFPLLAGFRGRPKADFAAAVSAIEGVAGFALANAGRLEELDINPLIVCVEGEGAWVADALMAVRGSVDASN